VNSNRNRVLLLSDPESVHTLKWANSLREKGIEISVIGLSVYGEEIVVKYPNIKIYGLGCDVGRDTGLSDIRYLGKLKLLKRLVEEIQPDIIHAHYATSYGLLGAILGRHPYMISVWGADVYEFPKKSLLHKALVKFNLSKADRVLSTSNCMAIETGKYTNKRIEVTPFGVDVEVFKPARRKLIFDENDIVIGTIKTLEEKYGVEYLIRAFSILVMKYKSLPLKLLIVGRGRLEKKLKNLVVELSLKDRVVFTGQISHEKVPDYFNAMDVSVSVSVFDSESFGVAVIEASACEKPVIVSNVGGLPEVVEDGVTGFVVSRKDPVDTAEAIEKLILDCELRSKMGRAGRKRVKKLYNWNENVDQMAGIYSSLLK
jgi:glycosyltransferase involved in cell wall biosynthesis